MQIVVKASAQQQQVLSSKPLPSNVSVHWVGTDNIPSQADAWFDLCYEEAGAAFPDITESPVFVNAVLTTTEALPDNYIRVNAWSSFLDRPVLEIVPGKKAHTATVILDQLDWAYTIVPDVPGMVAASVIAMIINEAYFAWGDEVSSKADIDTAMKLGTNYPYGPFEWTALIGIEKIYRLLSILAKEDDRYTPAPALVSEAQNGKS